MMTKKVFFLVVVFAVSVLALWGCPKKAEVTAAPEAQKEVAPKEEAKPEAKAEAKEEAKERAAAAEEGLKPIYFDFDKSFIRADAEAAMKANAEWLKANPMAKIKIEGNCDERGTKEYNLALGQRRAASAKKYFAGMGIKASRISLISYGKEKPLCTEHNEECWQKNRRDDFVVVSE